MADLLVTAANVDRSGSGAEAKFIAGETITAGQALYQNATDKKAYKAQNDGTAAQAKSVGIALDGASALQPVVVITAGELDAGATLVVGETYVVSSTFGGIAPIADLAATNFVTHLGVASAANKLIVKINATGVAHA